MAEELRERFAIIRNKSGLNVKQFAESLEMAPTTVSSIESGTREPSKDVLTKLAIRYQVNLNWMLTGEGSEYETPSAGISRSILDMGGPGIQIPTASALKYGALPDKESDIAQGAPANEISLLKHQGELPPNGFLVPMLDQSLSAGPGTAVPDDDTVVGYVAVPNELRRYGAKVAALTVRGDSMEPTLYDGDMVLCDSGGWDGEGVYAVKIDGEGFVKRLSKRPLGLAVISDNAKYPAYEVPGEQVDVVGRVRYGIRKM